MIPNRRNFDNAPGRFFVQNAGLGSHMGDTAKSEVKYLRIVESPEKRSFSVGAWGGKGGQWPA